MHTVSEQRLAYLPSSGARDAGAEEILSAPAQAASTSWPLWTVLTLFWVHVTLLNVLYASNMSMALDPRGVNHYFAGWDARVLQHVFLYPVLVGAIWVSLQLGWRPAWRSVPLQILLGIAFAALAEPFLGIAEGWVEPQVMSSAGGWGSHMRLLAPFLMVGGRDRSLWIASSASFFLTYAFALALTTGLALYRRYRDSELRLATLERAWSSARLAALRMQLSPHTLFNLLHTIRGQIEWDPATAQSMVVQLGDLLRRLLTAGERDFCRLTEEMQFVRLYLELQQRRFADRLQLSLPDGAQLPPVWVPSLILQPLIENAVVHGLAGHAGIVAVRLEVSIAEQLLLLRVSNGTAAESPPHAAGFGLRNVRERLAVHFGDRAALHVGPSAPAEWSAAIHLPLIYEGQQGQQGQPPTAHRQ
jgi:hypothetical protein